MSELRVGEGAEGRGDGSEPLLQLHRARTNPLPQPLIDYHIIFMSLMNTQCSHYGVGVLLGSASPPYHSLDYREKRQLGEEGTPDVEPDEGGGGTGR